VRPVEGGRYELIAGERRTRAVKLLGRAEIEVLLEADCDDAAAAVLSLLEKTARRDLNAIEEARAYAALIEDLGLTQEAVAKSAGRPRSTVANHLRLLTLPEEALALIASGALSFAHGRALLLAQDASVRRQLAKQAADEGWSTRQLETAARGANEQPNKPRAKPAADPQRASFAKDLAARVVAGSGLNCKVQVSGDGYAFQFTADTDDEAAVIANALARYRRANAET
jgi:ParB family chromosome partitioning protein